VVPTKCGNVIYNAKPIYMADRLREVQELGVDSLRMSFTVEDYDSVCRVVLAYQEALAGKKVPAPAGDFTRGHFYRGMQ